VGAGKHAHGRVDLTAKLVLDVVTSAALLVLLAPLIAIVAVAIKADSRGSVFYRCTRCGLGGREFRMLKFRKMYDDASGPPLTLTSDARLTRVGQFLARTKIDEIPQLWNVLKGEMSLVGPRPEDPAFVEQLPEKYSTILGVKPGVTGLTQLAFAREGEILDPGDRVRDYVTRLLPQKTALDILYSRERSLQMDLKILAWTIVAVVLRRDVAVNRQTGKLGTRRRPTKRRVSSVAPTLEQET